jgi:GNAT superfamily N-acetyltransferase
MTSEYLPVPARVAGPADIDAVVATLTTAFFDDPVWGPAFPDADRRAVQAAAMWRVYVTSALRYPWTLVTEKVEAAAVWIPPGGTELTHQEEGELKSILLGSTDPEVAGGIMAIYDRFEAAMPDEPHFYLTLLGTHDDHRGKGLGMGLVTESLARIDALGAPAYLESSNPANNVRYERLGFVARDRFTIAATGHVVTTMWRPAQRNSAELA